MTGQEIKDDVNLFYAHRDWKHLRRKVIELDHGECFECRKRGRYTKGLICHHVNHVKVKPELALDLYYIDDEGNKQRNIVYVCKECHETVCHPERLRWREKKKPLTQEKW